MRSRNVYTPIHAIDVNKKQTVKVIRCALFLLAAVLQCWGSTALS